jgi:predicted DNA-binding protein (MmcQ/YjbR family)
MVTAEEFSKMALGFPQTLEQPHFEKISFRIKKKIFATLSVTSGIACVKLSLADQSVFCLTDTTVIYPVHNKWGQQGWTNINLQKITRPALTDILTTAYKEVIKTPRKN